MDMSQEVQEEVFMILSAILRLGNIRFEGSDVSKIANPEGE